MKSKIIIISEFFIILVLLGLYINKSISFSKNSLVIREPISPKESQISYEPLPHPRLSFSAVTSLIDGKKKNFTPKIEEITKDIYLASGYMLGSMMMVITNDGLVIIDSGENGTIAKETVKKFKEISNQRIRYIIYTHGHIDHIYGAAAIKEPGTEIIASNLTEYMIEKDLFLLNEFHTQARDNQRGESSSEFSLNSPFKLPFKPFRPEMIASPTITFDKEYSFDLGGKQFKLMLAPGETPGQIIIWMPEEKTVFCGDLYYKSFPNLSSPMLEPRPVKEWALSLDKIASLQPEYLIPSHTAAIKGKENVQQVLQNHSEAIKYVYNKTIDAINAGLTVDEAVQNIHLPNHLVDLPQLKEVYGRVDWSIRGIYQKETGWYNGDGTDLNPLPKNHLSAEVVELSGGADKLLQRAIELQLAGEHQLVCEICDLVINANPKDKMAYIIKSHSLDYLGYMHGNANMFGFYRSAAAIQREQSFK